MIAKKVSKTQPIENTKYPYIGDIVNESELRMIASNDALFLAATNLIEKHPDEFTAVVGTPTGTVVANACGSIELPIRTIKLGQRLSFRQVVREVNKK